MQYKAKAIGSGSEGAQTNLQESYSENFTLEEAETLAMRTLKQVMEEKISKDNIEAAKVTADGYQLYDAQSLQVSAELLVHLAYPIFAPNLTGISWQAMIDRI